MRKIVVVIATILMIAFCSVSVCAKNTEVYLVSQTAYVDRLFDISITSDKANNISGGMFTLSYDSSVVEFKSVDSDNFDVEYKKENSESVKVVFVIDEDFCESDELMRVKFKGKREGSADVEMVCSELVDRGLNVSQGLSCESVRVDVKSKDSATNDEVNRESTADNVASADSYSVNSESSSGVKKALLISSGVVAVVALSVNAWFLFTKYRG